MATVKLSFTAPRYTTRLFQGSPVEPKEIKCWHVWVSGNGINGWTELTDGAPVPFATRVYNATQPNSSTRYYSITSEENSRLESRCLGNIWKVTVDGSGNITTSQQQTAYPSDPGASVPFWITPPPKITGLSFTSQASPYHKKLAWTEPTNSKVRYYNIYYSTSSSPAISQTRRIASVPVGTNSYLDWCADPNSTNHFYAITTVDRQGNESSAAYISQHSTPVSPKNFTVN